MHLLKIIPIGIDTAMPKNDHYLVSTSASGFEQFEKSSAHWKRDSRQGETIERKMFLALPDLSLVVNDRGVKVIIVGYRRTAVGR